MPIVWIVLGFGILFLVQRAVYIRFWDRKTSVSFRFSERAVTEGESVWLAERSENRKRLPLPYFGYRYSLIRCFAPISAADEKPRTVRRKLALPGMRAVTNRAEIRGLVRGVYSIDNISISSADLFRVTELERPAASGSPLLTVYPAKVDVKRFAVPARLILGSISTRRRSQEDPFALRSIRPYEIYDSPRTINWKASAKTGELKVNQYDYTTDESLIFLLDMGGGSIGAREELIRVASSLCLYFLRRGVSVELMANCRDCRIGRPIRIPAGADAAHQKTVDETLALISLTAPVSEPFADFLAGIPEGALKGALPVAVSADPTDGARAAFTAVPALAGGYFLSVGEDGDIRTDSMLELASSDSVGKEARL